MRLSLFGLVKKLGPYQRNESTKKRPSETKKMLTDRTLKTGYEKCDV